MLSFVEIGPPVQEKKIFEGFLPYMGMAAILVMCRPGLILIVNHDYFYSIEIFFNRKLFCNRRFL